MSLNVLEEESSPWRDLQVSAKLLRPQHCLTTGQTFSWKMCGTNEWMGVLQSKVFHIKQTETTTLYRCLFDNAQHKSVEAAESCHRYVLWDFFNMNECLEKMYERWRSIDEQMNELLEYLKGMRALHLDPVECLFSFICSSNNNIPRITTMVDHMRQKYGEHLVTVQVIPYNVCDASNTIEMKGVGGPAVFEDGYTGCLKMQHKSYVNGMKRRGVIGDDVSAKKRRKTTKGTIIMYSECPHHEPLPPSKTFAWYAFPTVKRLAESSEEELRELGLGYRAKSIHRAARQLLSFGGVQWLTELKTLSRQECQSELLRLCGVGPKVADCVALYSMKKFEVIPVDTHVWKIASRDMDPTLLQVKSLTPIIYERVGDLFRTKYSPFAGWAQCYLFSNELKKYAKPKRAQQKKKLGLPLNES